MIGDEYGLYKTIPKVIREGTGFFYVSLTYATFAVRSDKGVIIEAAPIAKWTIGKTIGEVYDYFKRKGVLIGWERLNV